MADIPWPIVFLIVGFIAVRRGWAWLAILCFVGVGVTANSSVIDAIIGGLQGLLLAAWNAVVTAANSVV